MAFEEFHKAILTKVTPFTMTSVERLFGLIEAVNYIVPSDDDGVFVECGVWKGGSILAAAETFMPFGQTSKQCLRLPTKISVVAAGRPQKCSNLKQTKAKAWFGLTPPLTK
jgi:hypothetical protein